MGDRPLAEFTAAFRRNPFRETARLGVGALFGAFAAAAGVMAVPALLLKIVLEVLDGTEGDE